MIANMILILVGGGMLCGALVVPLEERALFAALAVGGLVFAGVGVWLEEMRERDER